MSGNTTPFTARKSDQPRKLAALRKASNQWQEADDVFSRLSRRMTTSLSLEALVAIFADELAQVIPYDHLMYRNTIGAQEFVYASGMGGQHRCDFRLTLEGTNYGGLTLTRRSRFSEEELEGVERLLAVVICPIRNACQYTAIQQAAHTDALTNIPNKRALDNALAKGCCLSDRHGDDYTLILCDLDNFKKVNDTHGHVVGDFILQAVAQELAKATRNSDSIYRFGGEEFAIILPHTAETEARQVADRIREYTSRISVNCGDTNVSTTASAGVAMRQIGETPLEWLARADDALYRAKDQGRNCTRVADFITHKA